MRCLFIPGHYAGVTRPRRIRVTYLDQYNKKERDGSRRRIANASRHEIDHLNGVLFIDHSSNWKRDGDFRKEKVFCEFSSLRTAGDGGQILSARSSEGATPLKFSLQLQNPILPADVRASAISRSGRGKSSTAGLIRSNLLPHRLLARSTAVLALMALRQLAQPLSQSAANRQNRRGEGSW